MIESLEDTLDLSPEEMSRIQAENEKILNCMTDQYTGHIKEFLSSTKYSKQKEGLFSVLRSAQAEAIINPGNLLQSSALSIIIPLFSLQYPIANTQPTLISGFLDWTGAMASIAAIKARSKINNVIVPYAWDILKLDGVLFLKEEKSCRYIPITFKEIMDNNFAAVKNDDLNINFDIIHLDIFNKSAEHPFPMPARIIRQLEKASTGNTWRKIIPTKLINRLRSLSSPEVMKADVGNMAFYEEMNFRIFAANQEGSRRASSNEIKSVILAAIQLFHLTKHMALHVIDIKNTQEKTLRIQNMGFSEALISVAHECAIKIMNAITQESIEGEAAIYVLKCASKICVNPDALEAKTCKLEARTCKIGLVEYTKLILET